MSFIKQWARQRRRSGSVSSGSFFSADMAALLSATALRHHSVGLPRGEVAGRRRSSADLIGAPCIIIYVLGCKNCQSKLWTKNLARAALTTDDGRLLLLPQAVGAY